MTDILAMHHLPASTRRALLARIEASGIATREVDDATHYHDGYHGNGVAFRSGVLTWCASSHVDTVLHEAAHAAMLTPAQRAEWDQDDVDTDEVRVMLQQVEWCRGVRGYGIGKALEQMERVGYEFAAAPGGYRDYSARGWWRAERGRGGGVSVESGT